MKEMKATAQPLAETTIVEKSRFAVF
ncbi:MAG: hypothetical protein JWR69_2566, partial [Pedosphaera sp.]|nr:hypothetical protein [Pedosphaera sp.]